MTDRNLKWAASGGTAIAIALATAMGMHFEGKNNHAHLDPIGVLTICYGHTKNVKPGDYRTDEECEQLLHVDMAEANRHVKRCIPVPLPIPVEAAFTDAAFNLGPSVVCGSTLQRKALAGDLEGACLQLTQAKNSDGGNRGWSFAAGKFFRGLFRRRSEEVDLCLYGVPGLR